MDEGYAGQTDHGDAARDAVAHGSIDLGLVNGGHGRSCGRDRGHDPGALEADPNVSRA